MKKIIVLLVLLLLMFPAQSFQAETTLAEVELAQVISEIADTKGENVIYLEQPLEKISIDIDYSQDFDVILKQLLTDSDYRFIQYNNYYLIGKFSRESAEFARQSETLFYKTEALSAQVLANKLEFPQLRIMVLEERDKLLIQGLPEDIAKVKQVIKELDQEDNLTQVQIQLTVVDITEESNDKINLEKISTAADTDDMYSFVRVGDTLEVLISEIINNITVNTEESVDKSLKIINPGLVTEIGTTGTLNISEEILSWRQGETTVTETGFTAEFTPHRVSSKGEIMTKVVFNTVNSSLLSTTTWLKPEETELIGLLNMNTNKVSRSVVGKADLKQKRTYAVYVTARPAASGAIAELGGLDQLIFIQHLPFNRFKPAYLQYLSSDDLTQPDIDLYFPGRENENVASLKTRKGTSYLELGLALSLFDGLTIDNRMIREDNDGMQLLIGLVDEVYLSESFKLKAGYYPLSFSVIDEQFTEQAGYAEIDYKPGPFLFNLHYSHNMEQDPLRLETGIKISSSPYLIIAVTGDFDQVNRILGGIRFEF